MEKIRFEDLGLSPVMMKTMQKIGYEHATPVQAMAIPPLMEWKDVTAKAPTGTGKTFAFGIPIVEHIDLEDEEVQALILAPTRELALQIGEELRLLAQQRQGVRVAVLYGGQAMQTQITALKKRPQIVVATPGRLLDHVQRRLVRLDKVRTAVLDEADRMVDMGFIKEVVKIMNLMKSRRNLALLSATISREVMDISWVFQRDPVEITVPEDEENKPDIDQYSISATGMQKVDTLDRIMKNEDYDRAIVFCNTKNMVRRLNGLLQQKKYSVDCIHGDMTQSLREKVMKSFRDGRIRILVATDVAARGLDIDDVDAIFNYDVPMENEHYTHRIGRTGRAKKRGVAYTFVSYQDIPRIKAISRYTSADITPVQFDDTGKLIAESGGADDA